MQSNGQFTCTNGLITAVQTCAPVQNGFSTYNTNQATPIDLATDIFNNIWYINYYTSTSSSLNTVVKYPYPSGEPIVMASSIVGPRGICADPSSGNLYYTLPYSSVVSKITQAGTSTTFSGSIGTPYACACDSIGNVYVYNGASSYYSIWKWGSSGQLLSTKWGNSVFNSYTYWYSGMTFDSLNNLYFVSYLSGTTCVITLINSYGNAVTWRSNTVNGAGALSYVNYITFSPQGQFFFTETNSYYPYINTITNSNSFYDLFLLVNPLGITFESTGAVWVTDQNGAYSIYRVLLTCLAPTIPSNGQLGTCTTAMNYGTSCQFVCNAGYQLVGSSTQCIGGYIIPQICVGTGGVCTIAAPMNGQLGVCSTTLSSGQTCFAVCNSGYQAIGQFICTQGNLTTSQTCVTVAQSYTQYTNLAFAYSIYFMVVDNANNIYVSQAPVGGASSSNLLIKLNALTGLASTYASGFNYNLGQFAIDPNSQTIYVPQYSGNSISRVLYSSASSSTSGTVSLNWVSSPVQPGASVVDLNGNLYVYGTYYGYIWKYNSAGVLITNNYAGYAFTICNWYCSMAVDSQSNLYMPYSYSSGNYIARISPAGVILSWSTSAISSPRGLAFNQAQQLAVIQAANDYPYLISTVGVVGGALSTLGFSTDYSLGFDSIGSLWIADQGNQWLWRIFPTCVIPTPPTNGQAGGCSTIMNTGTSCQFVCNSGYSLVGAATICTGGSIIPQTCMISTSCIIVPPSYGTLGSCTSPLPSGSSCIASCTSGYQSLNQFTCQGGVLTQLQTCSPLQTSYASYISNYATSAMGHIVSDIFGNVWAPIAQVTGGASGANILLKFVPSNTLIPSTFASGFANPVGVATDPNNGNIYVSNNIASGYISKITQVGGSLSIGLLLILLLLLARVLW